MLTFLAIYYSTYICVTHYLHVVSSTKGKRKISMLSSETLSGACPHILRKQHNFPILTKDCESMTHRDVACLFRTPEHKYPLALWDISSAAPPGLAEKRWRGVLVIIRANPNLVRPPVQNRATLSARPVKSHKQAAYPHEQFIIRTKRETASYQVWLSWISCICHGFISNRTIFQLFMFSEWAHKACQAKQMWVQTSYVVLVFQEAPPLVPKALFSRSLSLSHFLSLSLTASKAHGDV